MARGRCTFRQRDVERALRAAVAALKADGVRSAIDAGIEVRAEIDQDGKIAVTMAKPASRELAPLNAAADEIVAL